MAAKDQIKDSEQEQSPSSPSPNPIEEGNQTDKFKLDGKYRKTFEKNLIVFGNPPKTLGELADKIKKANDDILQKAANGKKKGIDDLPTNLNGNRFPLDLGNPSIDSGLGDWRQTATDFQYPGIEAKSGFTKPVSVPIEISKKNFDPKKLKDETQPAVERIRTRKQYYNLFEDYAGKQFTHLLDYFSAQNGLGDMRPIPAGTYKDGQTIGPNTSDIYLGSFIKTPDDNEDPTMLGFDLKIKTADSPLFNGTAESFIKQFSSYGNSEIGARGPILAAFKEQFINFFKTDGASARSFNGGDGTKTYYLKKLTGLNKLNDTSDSNESKQFVDYGKDFITIGFYEDVTQNAGYLASLYKALSYSRLNGKLILPENVLRFDVDIEITEIRKYKRVFKNLADNKLEFVADKISKYTYTLYECQFFFPNLPHNDALDLSQPATVDDFEFKFNFKWSSLKFSKFLYEISKPNVVVGENAIDEILINELGLDNKYLDPRSVKSNSTDNNVILDGSIQSLPKVETPKSMGGVEIDNGAKIEPSTDKGGDLEPIKKAEETKTAGEEQQPDSLVTDTTNTTVEPIPGNLGSIGSKISSSLTQTTGDLVQKVIPTDTLTKALDGVKASTIFPSVKRFSQDILGGGLIKGDLLNDVGKTLNFDGITKALNSVTAGTIAPTIKKFSQDILGGSLVGGDLLNAIGGKTINFDSITKALGSVTAGTIAPTIKGFTQNILGGSLVGGDLLNAIGGKTINFDSITKALDSVTAGTIAPTIKKFSQDILGGSLLGGDLINTVSKSLNFDGITKALDSVTAGTIAPTIKKFSQDILSGSLIKGDLLGALGGKTINFDNISKALDSVTAGTIGPTIKKFSQDILGGSLIKGDLANALGGKSINFDSITKALDSVTAGTIAPTLKKFSQDILGGSLIKGGSSDIGKKILTSDLFNQSLESVKNFVDKKGTDLISQKLEQIKSSVISPSVKKFAQDIIGGEKVKGALNSDFVSKATKSIVSQASLLNKTLANITSVIPTAKPKINDLTKKAQNFVGKSLKNFFQK